jgi:hypothetical protein
LTNEAVVVPPRVVAWIVAVAAVVAVVAVLIAGLLLG